MDIMKPSYREVVMQRSKALLIASLLISIIGCAHADTVLSAYGTYWEGDDSGHGAGIRLKKTFMAFMAVEGRTGYCEFTGSNTEIIPVDFAVSARLPFMISPYAGIGAGYYFADSKTYSLDDFSGSFVQVGVEATFVWVGALAEVRYYDMEEDAFDGPAYNVGILLKW